jgi:predicted aldo/keto reductase-like oxidoreductase
LLQLYDVFGIHTVDGQIKSLAGNERADPAKCVACGACVEACPQDLDIPGRMERLSAVVAELNQA